MKYRIIGNTMPAVEVLFDQPGEQMYTQSGGMAWMTDGIKMETSTGGGLLKGVGRMFAGENMFQNRFTAQENLGNLRLLIFQTCIRCRHI